MVVLLLVTQWLEKERRSLERRTVRTERKQSFGLSSLCFLRVPFVYLCFSFVYRLCIFVLRVPFVYLCPSCTVCVPLFLLRVPFVYLCPSCTVCVSLSFVYRLCTSVSPLWGRLCTVYTSFVYAFFTLCVPLY